MPSSRSVTLTAAPGAALVAAATMAVGAVVACAALGGRHRDQRTDVVLFGSRRFW